MDGRLMPRSGFSAKVEDEARARAKGFCEDCGGQLKPGKYEFDHIKPRALGGDNSLENCRLRCVACHLIKTQEDDMPAIRTANRKGKVTHGLIVAAGMPEIARRFLGADET
jgi:5-methylcytosine-specific restriction endonuclease McrA